MRGAAIGPRLTLCGDFGPKRKQTRAFPEVHFANAFIGNVLRFEILSREGRARQIFNEAADYWLYMADRTGTLWEYVDEKASCNHGFASHICRVLYRDILGIHKIDSLKKSVSVRFCDARHGGQVALNWCRGRIPTPDGFVSLWWRKENGRLVWSLDAHAGYRVAAENMSGLEAAREP